MDNSKADELIGAIERIEDLLEEIRDKFNSLKDK